jgi:hypothetical protein
LRDLDSIVECVIKTNELENSARLSNQSITTTETFLDQELIVSLTSYSTKIHEVHLVIESIFQQTIRPNRVILWLDENEFSNENLPLILHKQIGRGLEVKFCPNYYSYKKIIPTLIMSPNAYVVTVDDDVIYGSNCIEILVNESKKHPKMIIGHRGHKIKFYDSNNISPYKKWEQSVHNTPSSHLICLTGCGSIIYPPNTLNKNVIDIETALQLAPKADDLWLKINAITNGTLCKITDYSCNMIALKNNRHLGLAHDNIGSGGNDKQMQRLLNYYPEALITLKATLINQK